MNEPFKTFHHLRTSDDWAKLDVKGKRIASLTANVDDADRDEMVSILFEDGSALFIKACWYNNGTAGLDFDTSE